MTRIHTHLLEVASY